MNRDNRRVLALMPHPDDIEILCAGTLIRLIGLGFEVHMATMTPGDVGSPDLPRQEIAAIRRGEAQRAADTLGAAGYTCLEFEDVQIVFDNDSRHRVAALVRRIDPLLVFTTPVDDYMFDHIITSMLVRDACFNASIPNYQTEGGESTSSGVPYLYYSDPVEGIDMYGRPVRPDCIVDISAQIDQKAAALACHESQRAWLRRQHGMDDYLETMRSWSAARGTEIGVAYGEGFRQHRGHPHPADDLLVTLLEAVPVT